MSNKRREEILNNLLNWCIEIYGNNPEAIADMISAMGLTEEEAIELDIAE